jgi:type I restriction enzyme R subunit
MSAHAYTEDQRVEQLRLAIEAVLDTGLPRVYSPELYQQKCARVFEHVFESYPERNAGVYAV